MPARSTPWLLMLLAAGGGSAADGRKVDHPKMQFAFFNFHDEHVQVSVDGRSVFDRAVTVVPDNARLGLAAVAQIELADCSDIVVKTKRQRVAERICLDAKTRSIVVDAGPPLTIVAKDRFQGAD